MEKLQIGLLLPTSTILPLSKEFEKGLRDGIKHQNTDIEYELSKEFIGQGNLKAIEEACNKLFNYDDADIVTGIVSNKAAETIADKFKSNQVPLLVNNVGGHIPTIAKLNEYIHINSMNLWSHAWALGYWGVKHFGKKGMFVSAMYDAGYSFSHMFNEGMKTADPTSEWFFSVTPMPEQGTLSNMDILFPFIEKYQPDFILATFCGTETTLFINEFIKRGYHKKIKLLGLPFLLYPFAPVDEDITIYTSMPFANDPDKATGQSFYHLGYRSGTTIVQAVLAGKGNLNAGIHSLGKTLSIDSDNSEKTYKNAIEKINIVRNDIKAGENSFAQIVVNADDAITIPDQVLKSISEEMTFGWLNPYLCV